MRSKILAALSALAIALGMIAFTATTAGATHPTVEGTAVCNTATGLFDITWKVGGDTQYSSETATIKTQSVATTPTLLEKTVQGSGFVTGLQSGVSAGTYSLTVKVQWTNHSLGDLVSKTGSVTTSGTCDIPTPDDAMATATPTPATCSGPGGVTFEITNARWENDTDLSDGSRKAIADDGHVFPGGFTTIDVGYQIQPQLTGAQCTPTCITAVWSMPNWINSTTPSWPQSLYTSFAAPCGDLTWTPPDGCGLQFQIDSYYDNAITRSLLAGGELYGSHNPDESLVPGGWGVAYRLVKSASECTTAPAATTIPATCTSPGLLSLTGAHVTFTVVQGDSPKGTFAGIAAGDYTVYNTWGDASSGPYYGPVTVTAQLDAGYSLPGFGMLVPLTANTAAPSTVTLATVASLGPWSLVVAAPFSCVDVVPSVTFTDICGTTNDAIIIPTQTGVTYTTTDNRTGGVGTVVVTAAPSSSAYVFGSKVTTTSWSFDFTNDACPFKLKPLTPGAIDPTCPQEPDAQSGYIQLDLKTGLNYFIDGVATTTAKNDRAPGTYTISVTVDQGYELEGPAEWELIVHEPFCPPTLAQLSTTASMSNLTCKAAGSYTLAATDGIAWFVNGSATATPAGTYPMSKAGVVNVEAKITDTVLHSWEDNAQTAWTFTFTNPADCLPTLAFTGSSGGNLGLLLSGGLLLFGGTIIAFERRFRRDLG